jgi:oligopeptidase B
MTLSLHYGNLLKSHFYAIPEAPVAKKIPVTSQHHHHDLTDNYHWLRAENWQEVMREPDLLAADIRDYLESENDYYARAMASTQALQQSLVKEMRARIKEDDNSVPVKHGMFAYGFKYQEGGEHPIYVRTSRNGEDERVLLDVNTEAQGHDYFELGLIEVDPTHSLLAWSYDNSGAECYTLVFRDIKTGQDRLEQIKDVGTAAWADANTIFYTRVDSNHRPSKIYRHILNTHPEDDVLVYEETDPAFYCSVGLTRSEQYIVIASGTNDQDELYVIPTQNVQADPKLIQKRQAGLEYNLEHQGERFLILTNAHGAVDFKIVETSLDATSMENWKDLVPSQANRMVLSCCAYKDWIIWLERENALPRICVMNGKGDISAIAMDEEVYSLSMSPSPEFDCNELRFTYSSPSTPRQVYDYCLSTGERILLKQTEIPSGHNRDDYITKRITAKSHDGAEVPITLLYHKNTAIDGSAPCWLEGYGAYGISIPAGFSSNRLSLVNRGFVYAIGHVRGGEEKGRAWYEDAKLGNKVNSFHDFIACAETLADLGYTTRGNIVIAGGSAGGLLVGAAVNMAPDLFAGVIADVPFVDVLNTILDDSLPLTPAEWSQWGNPIESEQAFKDIASYSPYDNIERKDYPAMLVTAGLSDPRVTYWEPAKWVAKLREHKTDNNILLLKTNMSSGHFGISGRFAALEDDARAYAFALKVVTMH